MIETSMATHTTAAIPHLYTKILYPVILVPTDGTMLTFLPSKMPAHLAKLRLASCLPGHTPGYVYRHDWGLIAGDDDELTVELLSPNQASPGMGHSGLR